MKTTISKIGYVFVLNMMFVNMIFSQADPSYRQNQYNVLMINPAQAGSNDFNDVTVSGTSSLIGVTGAPKTFSASGNFKLFDELGVGVTAYRDQLGPIVTTRGSLNFAYQLRLNRKWKLAAGVRGIVSTMNIDLPSLNTTVAFDPNMARSLNSGTTLSAGWGLLVYSKKMYFGIAQPRVGKNKYSNSNMADYIESTGGLAYTGINVDLSRDYQFRPYLLVRYIKNQPLYAELNATFTYKKVFDFGVFYQYGANVGANIGFDVYEKLYFGYAYSVPVSKLSNVSMQSHELVIRLKLKQAKFSKFHGPRFFN